MGKDGGGEASDESGSETGTETGDTTGDEDSTTSSTTTGDGDGDPATGDDGWLDAHALLHGGGLWSAAVNDDRIDSGNLHEDDIPKEATYEVSIVHRASTYLDEKGLSAKFLQIRQRLEKHSCLFNGLLEWCIHENRGAAKIVEISLSAREESATHGRATRGPLTRRKE